MAALGGGTTRGPAQVELRQEEGGADLPFAAFEEDPREVFDENIELEAALHGVGARAAAADFHAICGCCSRTGRFAHIAASIRQSLQRFGRRSQQQGLQILQMLSCNISFYFIEDLSPRNVIFLIMSGSVFISAWESLEPCDGVWAMGLLYVLTASAQLTRLQPLLATSLALAAQLGFGLAAGASQRVLWHVLGAFGALSEICWWPNTQQLIEHSLHLWLTHFSTYYAIVIDFWLWPQALQVDPDKWHITETITKASSDTKDAIVDVSVGLAIIILVPLLACTGIAILIIWHRSPRLCIVITILYVSFVSVLLVYKNVSPKEAANVGQVPIAVIFVALAREQLVNTFGDSCTWKVQAALMASLLVLRRLAAVLISPPASEKAEVVGMLVVQFLFKQGLAAQCSAIQVGQRSMWQLPTWLPVPRGLISTQTEQPQ